MRDCLSETRLLLRREVALLGADLIAAIVAVKIDCSESAVVLEVRRSVDQCILATQFLLDIVEAGSDLFDRRREEDLAAGIAG